MNDMPETIWAWFFVPNKRDDVIKGGWNDEHDRKETKYIRADIATTPPVAMDLPEVQATVRSLEYQIRELCGTIDEHAAMPCKSLAQRMEAAAARARQVLKEKP